MTLNLNVQDGLTSSDTNSVFWSGPVLNPVEMLWKDLKRVAPEFTLDVLRPWLALRLSSSVRNTGPKFLLDIVHTSLHISTAGL